MTKRLYFRKLTYVRGEPSYIKQGVKRGKTPPNALRGGNGSFRVLGAPSELWLFLSDEEGNILEFDVYHQILEKYDRKKITSKLLERVTEELRKSTFVIQDGQLMW